MTITENGRTMKMSKQRVMTKSLCTKAIQGDTRSTKVVMDLLLRLVSQEDDAEQEVVVSTSDQQIIDRYIKRQKESEN